MSATQRALFVVPPALLVLALIGVPFLRRQSGAPQQLQFELVEATISDVHRAIQQGQITCRGLVEAYLQRARAYNHSSDRLVTRDGKPIPPARGTVRAGKPIEFPTETVPISLLLPNFDRYAGPPIEFGRMEPTASDPEVQQQYGMTVGTLNSGKVNTLATFNLRGERSVTCKGDRDRHPSSGSLPAGTPPVCEEFRKQPDALERASELDAQYGRNRIWRSSQCIASHSRSRIPLRRKTCGRPAPPTPGTTSIFRRAITHWSRSCVRRAP